MEQIEPFRITKVPLRELNAMMQQVVEWFVALGTHHARLMEAIRRLQVCSDALNAFIFRDKGDGVQKLQEADQRRTEAWRLLRAYVKAMQGHPDEAVASAAREAYQQITARGNVAALSQPERSTNLHILTKWLEEQEEVCRLLALEVWLVRLQVHNATYDAYDHAVSQQQGAQEPGKAMQLRLQLEQAYRTVCLQINAAAIYESDGHFSDLISQLNALQREHTRVRKFRQSMKENREDEKKASKGIRHEKIT